MTPRNTYQATNQGSGVTSAVLPVLKAKSSSVKSEECTKSNRSFPSDLESDRGEERKGAQQKDKERERTCACVLAMSALRVVREKNALKAAIRLRRTQKLILDESLRVVPRLPSLKALTLPNAPSHGSHFMVTQAALEKRPLVNTGRAVLAQSPKTRTMAGPQLEAAAEGEKVAK